MIKWFCDICGLEIESPHHPQRVKAYRCGKNRDDEEIGWGGTHDIISVFAHKQCANLLETEIKAALDRTKRTVKNNA